MSRGTVVGQSYRYGFTPEEVPNRVLGSHDGIPRVSVTAAAIKDKANKAAVDVLSQVFCVPKSSLYLLPGATSPRKRVLFLNVDPNEPQDRCILLIESN